MPQAFIFLLLLLFFRRRGAYSKTKIYKRALAPQELLRLYFILFTFSLIVTAFAGRNKIAKPDTAFIGLLPPEKNGQGLLCLRVKKDLYWGYVDIRGNWAISPRSESAYPFSNKRAAVLTGKGYRFIRPDGAFAFAELFTDAERSLADARRSPLEGWQIDTAGKGRNPAYF